MKDTRRKKFIVGVIIAIVTVLAIVGLPKLFSSIRKYYLKHPFKALGLPVSLKTIFITITVLVIIIILFLLKQKKKLASQATTEQAIEQVMQAHEKSSGVLNEKDKMNLF